jgi:hypothetical protein
MPNWCSNRLTLTHKDPAQIQAAIQAFDQGNFLAHFVPMPNGQWDYSWCVQNWGTKWDVGSNGSECQQLDNNSAEFHFDSAWSPPVEVYRAMTEQGFELAATYYESGMAFVGKVVGNATEFENEWYNYSDSQVDLVRGIIGEELDDEWGITESLLDWAEMEQDQIENEDQ